MNAEAIIALALAVATAGAALARLAYQVGRAAKGIDHLRAMVQTLHHDQTQTILPAIRSHRRILFQHEARLNELQRGQTRSTCEADPDAA